MSETKEEIIAGFGWVSISHTHYHIAVCRSCHAAVFMTEEQRSEDILYRLDTQIECCKHPKYFFHPIKTI